MDEDLGKKIVLLDFFTYCCINCHHIFPYLKEVETKFADNKEFQVIGIHSPKFTNEKSLQQVKEAVLRHGLKHPVLNDSETTLWKIFGISFWPTVFIVGPDLTLLFVLIGEVQIEKISVLIEVILNYFERYEALDFTYLPVCEMKEPEHFAGLLYPSNLSTNGIDLLVSDTGHNRLLLMSKSLEVQQIIGSGVIGNNDGSFYEASFNSPHGSTWLGDLIAYVADTENHSIRKIDFQNKVVTTVYDGRYVEIKQEERIIKFRSPWDVCLAHHIDEESNKQSALYIAVAGSHQIWALDLRKGSDSTDFCQPFAGSGKEENRPNHYRLKAGFAQPSCVEYSKYVMNDHLLIADSESSTIKIVSLRDSCVKNVIGSNLDPTDLFQFGDKDGPGKEARLQHPMCVYVLNWDNLIICDTYNHKLKVFSIVNNMCQGILTSSNWNEPSSISILEDTLFVCDTNNHRIVPIPIEEIMAEIPPVQYDLEIVSYNVMLEDVPKTVILLPKDGRLFCHFNIVSDEIYSINKSGPQKLDISFKGKKLETVYKSERYFGAAQPSLILKKTNHIENIKGIYQPTEAVIVVCVPMCEKAKTLCCFKKVAFKVVVNDAQSKAKNICLKLDLKYEDKLFE